MDDVGALSYQFVHLVLILLELVLVDITTIFAQASEERTRKNIFSSSWTAVCDLVHKNGGQNKITPLMLNTASAN